MVIVRYLIIIASFSYLYSKSEIDFSILGGLVQYWPFWLLALVLLLLDYLFGALRWRQLLSTKGKGKWLISNLFKIELASQFLSMLASLSFAQEVSKMVLIVKNHKGLSKSHVLASLIMEKILAALSFMILIFVNLVLFREGLKVNPQVQLGLWYLQLILGGTLLGTMVYLAVPIRKKIFGLEKLEEIKAQKGRLVKALLFSLAAQITATMAFWVVTMNFTGEMLGWREALTLIPIGLSSVPLTLVPGGIGGGNIIFEHLFALVGQENGASIFNLHISLFFAVSLMGGFIFVGSNKMGN